MPLEKRNFFYRGFNRVYNRMEGGYAKLIGVLVRHANISVIMALVLIGISGYGLARVPTGFLPIEDQGYLIAAVQLPDGAALDRTQSALDKVSEIVGKAPGVEQVITIAGISALDNSSSPANAGVAYIILKDWGSRGPGEDLRSLVYGLNDKVAAIMEARTLILPPPPIQGIGNAAGFAMQVELRDGNSDYGELQAITGAMVRSAVSQSALQRVQSPFRATVPQFNVEVDRIKTQTLQVTTDQVFSTLASYLGSSYVNQFDKFGHVFQVSRAGRRQTSADVARHRQHDGAQSKRRHDPARHDRQRHADGRSLADQPLQSLPVGNHRRPAGARLQFRAVAQPDGADCETRPCRQAQATNGLGRPTRRRPYPVRSIMYSASPCCSSTSCSPDSMRVGMRRSP